MLQNWSTAKKSITFCIVCLAAFGGILQALTNSAGFFAQAVVYEKTPVQISYSVCCLHRSHQPRTLTICSSPLQSQASPRVLCSGRRWQGRSENVPASSGP